MNGATKNKKKERHIPSRYIHYTYVCRNCGESDDGFFDKFTEPKKQQLLCSKCEIEAISETDYLPF